MKTPLIFDNRGPTQFGPTSFISPSEEAPSPFSFDSINGLAIDINPVLSKIDAVLDGDPIETLNDSKNNYVFSQSTLAKKPLWNQSDSNFNSQPSMTFDGIDDLLILGSQPLVGGVGVAFIVCRDLHVGPVNKSALSAADTGSSSRYIKFRAPNYRARIDVVFNQGAVDAEVEGSTPIVNGTPYILTTVAQGSWSFFVNANNEVETTLSHGNTGKWIGDVPSPNNIVVGAVKNNIEFESFEGEIARILIYNASLTQGNIDTIHTELSNLYGISI